MANCFVQDCQNTAPNALSIRCRDRDANAIWATSLNANLCDVHARQGCTIDIIITPSTSKTVDTVTRSGADGLATNVHKIKDIDDKADGKDSLFTQSDSSD